MTANQFSFPEETVLLSVYYEKGMNNWKEGQEEYSTSQKHRKRSLVMYKDCGLDFLYIKNSLANASKLHPISSDMGEFTSFEHFLREHQTHSQSTLGKTQIYKYIKLAENWDVVEELKLMEENAAYRLEITMDIIRWGLEKREEGYDLTELDHHLYFQEKKGKGELDKRVPSKKELLIRNAVLEAKVEELTLENDRLKAELCLRHS
jgi:hypothetical protein